MGVVLLQCVWIFSGASIGFLEAVSNGYMRSLSMMEITTGTVRELNLDALVVHLLWQGITTAAGVLVVLKVLKKETSAYEAFLWPTLLFAACVFFVGLYLANYYVARSWHVLYQDRGPAPPFYLIQPAILCALSAWRMVRRAREIREGVIVEFQKAA